VLPKVAEDVLPRQHILFFKKARTVVQAVHTFDEGLPDQPPARAAHLSRRTVGTGGMLHAAIPVHLIRKRDTYCLPSLDFVEQLQRFRPNLMLVLAQAGNGIGKLPRSYRIELHKLVPHDLFLNAS
jgi:hypothetical protein